MRKSLEWAGLEYDEGVLRAHDRLGEADTQVSVLEATMDRIFSQNDKTYIITTSSSYSRYAILETSLLAPLTSQSDNAYECFCSPDELQAIKASLSTTGSRMSYDGRCRHLTEEERSRRKKAGQPYVVRFKVGQ